MKALDVTGKRFGRLIAIKRNGFDQSPSRKHVRWDCICDCGKKINVRLNALTTGHSKSCGCLHDEGNNKRHGLCRSREYQTWVRIKDRCLNKNNQDYYLYGARGIQVCDRWANSFENFLSDMGKRPKGKYSIDRIDNNGDYEPSNCRWADIKTQSRNKRGVRIYEHNGLRMCMTDWAKKLGITFSSLSERLEKWPLDRALTLIKKEN